MLLIGLFGLITVIGIICLIAERYTYKLSDCLCYVGIVLALAGMVTLILLCIIAININVTATAEYESALYTKEVLEYRLCHEDLYGNEMLYTQTVEFNNMVRSAKIWSENPWTNVFNNRLIAEIDYIVIPGMEETP